MCRSGRENTIQYSVRGRREKWENEWDDVKLNDKEQGHPIDEMLARFLDIFATVQCSTT